MSASTVTSKRSSIQRWRAILVALVAFVGLAALAGERLLAPSANNHFAHMAQGWLDARLALPGKPPGWCSARDRAAKRCTGHRYDDYAVVWELTLADGRTVRGFPCQTEACRRDRGGTTWWIIGRGWQRLTRGSIVSRDDTWYVSFPPGPAVVFTPLVAIWGTGVWDVMVTALAAALIPGLLVAFFDRERGLADGRGREHLWAAAAWTFASPACVLGAHGRVWFTAQVFAALGLLAAVSCAWRMRSPVWAGLFWSFAVACRPINMVLTLPLFVWIWWCHGRTLAGALRFVIPAAFVGVVVAVHNYARFEDVFEFGHRFLDIRWQARIQEHGLFSLRYLPRNLEVMLALLPQLQSSFPFVRVSIHGMALWLSAPWVVAIVAARERFVERIGLWCAAVAAAVPSLLYQNSGMIQPSYRFAVDWLPLVLLAMVFGGAARSRWFRLAVVLGVLVQGVSAYYFARDPGRLFVTSPLGWPFEHEFAH